MAAQLRILAVFHRGLNQSLVLSVAQAILLLPANGWLVHLLPGFTNRSLSRDVFERRMSIGSEAFSLFKCHDNNKFVSLSFFSLIKTIYPRVSTKPRV